MSEHHHSELVQAISALLSATVVQSATAQEAEKRAYVTELDPITVTATRTERPAFAVPESVSVISLSGFARFNWHPLLHHRLTFSMQGYSQDGEMPSNPSANLSSSNVLLDRNTQQYDYVLRYRYEDPESRILRPEALLYYVTTDIDENQVLISPRDTQRQDETELATFGFGLHNSIVEEQDRVPTGDFPTDGYTVHDLFLSWLPDQGPGRGLRFDFGVDNVTDKDHRRHLAVLKEPGINIRASLSYSF